MILPERVLGRSGTRNTALGRAIGPSLRATCWRISSARLPEASALPTSIAYPTMAWPFRSSDAPTTAASATAGWSTMADSTSAVEMRWPDTFMTSSTRPSSHR